MNKTTLPHNNHISVSSLFLPSRVVSGDHIQTFIISDDEMGILLFDVSGKGIDSGIKRNTILKFFHTAFKQSYQPEFVLNFVHQEMFKDATLATYATVFYGILDTKKNTLTYINAGHDPIVHIHNKTISELRAEQMQIGADPSDIYKEIACYFRPSDQLILYSDGLTDAINGSQESFGLDRVKALLQNIYQLPSEDILKTLHHAVMDFSYGVEQKDDISILVVKYETRQDTEYNLRKKSIVLTVGISEKNNALIKQTLEPALDILQLNSIAEAEKLLPQHLEEILILFVGPMATCEDIMAICDCSKLLEVIVIADIDDSDLCKAYMKAGARNVVNDISDCHLIENLAKDSIKRIDTLRRAIKNSSQQNISDWVALTTELLQCCHASQFQISRMDLAGLCRLLQGGDLKNESVPVQPRSETVSPLVLTVEDDPRVLQRIRRLLKMEGYTFFESENKRDALVVAESKGVDICLLDIGLPDGSGLELIPELKRINPDIEIIMVTAFNNSENIIPAFQFGALDYLVKPIDKELLLQKIAQASQRNFLNKLARTHINPAPIEKKKDLALRLHLVEQLGIYRIKNGKHLLFKDIYMLFPEIESIQSGDDVISDDDVRRHLSEMIQSLLSK